MSLKGNHEFVYYAPENGEYTINAQEGYDALEEVDLTVSVESGVASANVYCQLTEPENRIRGERPQLPGGPVLAVRVSSAGLPA